MIALLTCEAEYIIVAETVKKGKWFKAFFQDLRFNYYGTCEFEIKSDNQKAIQLMQNPVLHGRSERIYLMYLFVKHQVDSSASRTAHLSK